ncbi:TonB-dependent receptor [Catenovulum adriaticum]|uniref:TonB-dependent receptor n=1 Tax=Catenovulum adriaticum TaxID=2984846 RepID=A0ABY7AQL3_9ALTE|nr:TonB-dependent receptor [Catenovulum sp. TS8]WAJ71834.1 TonB-dependent receptor [Catenovulum sp. TS8]
MCQFNKTIIASSVICAVSLSFPAIAAQNELNQSEVIHVSGVRASLKDSVDAKKAAANIIDGVSAEDIGQLPDVSIADSIRRIVGVNFSTQNGEPAFASVRGLGPDLTLTTLNGRVLSTTDQASRRVALGRLPSELVRRVYIAKSPMAKSIEGGVAGTIGLETIRPLDRQKQVISGVFRGLYNENASDIDTMDEYGWRGTINYVDQFMDGRLGIALGWAGLSEDSPTYEGKTGILLNRNGDSSRSDFNNDGIRDVTVGAVSNDVVERSTERDSVLAVVQYIANDNLDLLLDVSWIKQDSLNENNRLIYEVLPAPANNATTADDAYVDPNTNVIMSIEEGKANSLIGLNPNNNLDETVNVGFTANYIEDDFEVKFDLSHSKSSRDRLNKTFNIGANAGVGGAAIQRPLSFSLLNPEQIYLVPDASLATPENWALRNMLDMKQFSEDRVNSASVDVKSYAYSGDFIDTIEAGVRFESRQVDRDNDRNNYKFNQGNPPPNWPDLSADYLEREQFAYKKLWETVGGVEQSATFPHFDQNKLYGLVMQAVDGDIDNNVFVDGEELNFDYTRSHKITEDSLAAYVQLNYDTYVADMPLRGNFGVRVVNTKLDSQGFSNDLSKIMLSENADEDGKFDVIFDNADIENIQTINASYDYTNVLPAFNASLEVTPSFIARAALAKTISRPVFEDITPGSFVATSGNAIETIKVNAGSPQLEPFTADQADIAFEWYPKQDLSFAATFYYKHLEAYLTQTQELTEFSQNGLTIPMEITRLVNEDKARYFKGLELSYNQIFSFLPEPFDGFGVQANATFNDTNATEQGAGIAGAPVTVDANEVSDEVYNLIGFYEKGPVSVRLAWQYQSPYTRVDDFNSSYQTQDDGQLDMTFGYTINKHVKLIGSVLNLTDEHIRRYRFDDRNLQNDQVTERLTFTGRKVSLGVRVSL